MMKNKMLSIMLVLSVVCLAMTATTFGIVDYVGYNEISTIVDIDPNDAFIQGGGEINIVSGGSFTCAGGRIGEGGATATLNVQVGGSLTMNGEVSMPFELAQTARLNVYADSYIEQLKMYGDGNDTETVIGNGTEAAILTIAEGLLGKNGDATITINAGSTMIITGTSSLSTDSWKIDGDALGTDSYIDLVDGGTLKVAAIIDPNLYASDIIANGGDDTVFSDTISEAGYIIYTAEPGKITAGSLANQWLTDAGGPVTVAMTAEVRNFVDGIDNHTYTYSVISEPNDHTASFAATVETNETATGVDLSAAVTFNEIGDYILEVKVDDSVTLLTYSETLAVHVYEDRCAAVKAELPYYASEAQLIGDTNYDCEVNLADFAAIASNWMDDVSVY